MHDASCVTQAKPICLGKCPQCHQYRTHSTPASAPQSDTTWVRNAIQFLAMIASHLLLQIHTASVGAPKRRDLAVSPVAVADLDPHEVSVPAVLTALPFCENFQKTCKASSAQGASRLSHGAVCALLDVIIPVTCVGVYTRCSNRNLTEEIADCNYRKDATSATRLITLCRLCRRLRAAANPSDSRVPQYSSVVAAAAAPVLTLRILLRFTAHPYPAHVQCLPACGGGRVSLRRWVHLCCVPVKVGMLRRKR